MALPIYVDAVMSREYLCGQTSLSDLLMTEVEKRFRGWVKPSCFGAWRQLDVALSLKRCKSDFH